MEETASSRFLRDTLAAHADVADLVAGRVYEAEAPPTRVRPYVLYDLHVPAQDRVACGSRSTILVRGLWLVKGVTEGTSYTAGDVLAAAIHRALMGATGVVTIDDEEFRILRIWRTSAVRYREAVAGSGTRYNHVGGLYRVQSCRR
jgi:hypothetical protein